MVELKDFVQMEARALPVIILADVSTSMSGERITMDEFVSKLSIGRKSYVNFESKTGEPFFIKLEGKIDYDHRSYILSISDPEASWELSDDYYYFFNNGVPICKNVMWELNIYM